LKNTGHNKSIGEWHGLQIPASKGVFNKTVCAGFILSLVMFVTGAVFAQDCDKLNVEALLAKSNETRFSDRQRSEQSAVYALECARKLNLKQEMMRSLNILGFHSLMSGRRKEAYQYFQESLRIAEGSQDSAYVAIAFNNLGNYYNHAGLDQLALEQYLASLNLKRKINFKKGLDVALFNIGVILDKQGKHQKALDHYEQALEIKTASNDTLGIARCYENIGVAYAENKQFEEAIQYFGRAGKIYKDINIKDGIISVELSRISAQIEADEKADVLTEINKLNELMDQTSDVVLLNLWFELKAKTAANLGRYEEAVRMVDSSRHYAKQAQDLSLEITTFELEADIYKKAGNRLDELINRNNALELKDSLDRITNRIALEEMQLRYETSELNNKIQLQNKDIELLNLSNRNRTYLLILITILALLIIVAILWIYVRNLRSKEELKKEIDERNKELMSFTMQTAKKNEAIKKLKETLIKAKEENSLAEERDIHYLIKEVEQTEDQWQEFRMRFEKIQPDFFKNLEAKYKLTETDRRICALIKLNVTTQEVANMLNITTESVNKARYRLRKKLDLPKEIDLNTFIRDFFK